MGKTDPIAKTILAFVTAALLLSLVAVVIAAAWLIFFGGDEPHVFFDINYYRDAVIDVTNGTKSMYEALPYPPFAFLMVSFLGGLPVLTGNQVWTANSILIVIVVALVVSQRAIQACGGDWRSDRIGLAIRTSANIVLLLISLPMASQLGNGQLSLAVMALSFVDTVGVLPRRYQGALVGIAGAIKVTPLIFIVYFLVTRQRHQAAVATAAFAAATGAAWALFPEGSLFFWTHVGKNDQFGDPTRSDNLSIHSSLARWSSELGQSTWLWVTLGMVVVIAAMWRARKHYDLGEQVEAVLVVGASATVVAPIAWPHYFTWLPLAGLWLMMTGGRRARWLGVGIYLAYSIAHVAVENALVSEEISRWTGVELLVLIPVLIGLFGLPHRSPSRLTVTESVEEPAPSALEVVDHAQSEAGCEPGAPSGP